MDELEPNGALACMPLTLLPAMGGEMEIVTGGGFDVSAFGGDMPADPMTGGTGPVGEGGLFCGAGLAGGAEKPACGGAPGLGKGKLAIDGKADDGFCGMVTAGDGVAAGGAETEGGGEGCDKVAVLNGEPGIKEVLGDMPRGAPRLMLGGVAAPEPKPGAGPAGVKLPKGPVGTPLLPGNGDAAFRLKSPCAGPHFGAVSSRLLGRGFRVIDT